MIIYLWFCETFLKGVNDRYFPYRFFDNVFYSIMHAVEKQHTYTKHIDCAMFFIMCGFYCLHCLLYILFNIKGRLLVVQGVRSKVRTHLL